MDATIANVITELKWAYGFLGLLTMVGSVGGAFAMIKFSIKTHSEKIESLQESRSAIYQRLNAQGESLSAANAKLDILIANMKQQ